MTQVAIRVDGDDAADQLRSLHDWITVDGRAGTSALTPREPSAGQLGVVADVLTVAVGPGGVAAALASVLVSWIRRRSGDCTLKISRPDGSVYEISVTNVRTGDTDEIRRIVADAADFLEDGPSGDRPS